MMRLSIRHFKYLLAASTLCVGIGLSHQAKADWDGHGGGWGGGYGDGWHHDDDHGWHHHWHPGWGYYVPPPVYVAPPPVYYAQPGY